MQDSGENDNLIKTPVQKLVRDLTEKYVSEAVKQAALDVLQKKADAFSKEWDLAWKGASEEEKKRLFKELEDRISHEILNCKTNSLDLQNSIECIIKESLDPSRLGPSKSTKSCKVTSDKKPLQAYLTKLLLAFLLISAVAYFSLPIIFPAELSVSTSNLDFGIMEESLPSPLTFAVRNLGMGTLSWNVHSDDSWISLDPTSGTDDGLVTVTITNSPQPGTNEGFIYVQSGNRQSHRIQVSLRVKSAPGISVDPKILSFTKRLDKRQKPAGQTLRIANSGERTLYWNAAKDASWITLNNYEGINDGEIQVGITGNQDPGIYHGTIAIRSNDKNIEVPVTLEVIAPAKLAVSPIPLMFNFEAYTTKPPEPQTFRIANDGGEVLLWNIRAEPWITATPTSGQVAGGSSQEVSIGIETNNLDYSDRIGDLVVSSNGGSTKGSVQLKREILLR